LLVRVAPLSGNRALGFSRESGPDGNVEVETFTCAHCLRITEIQKGEDIGKMCMPCHAMICTACVARGICEPFEKMLARREKEEAQRRGLLTAAGIG